MRETEPEKEVEKWPRRAAVNEREKGGREIAYQLEGRILEVCDCKVLCPCWIGEDPDNGTCDAVVACHVDKGTVDGVDVSGHTVTLLGHIPGNILEGNWKAVALVDEEATPEQQETLLNVFTGKLGGPLADFAQLIGEVVAVEQAPITFTVKEGKGTLKIGSGMTPVVEADMASYMGSTEKPTTLQDSSKQTRASGDRVRGDGTARCRWSVRVMCGIRHRVKLPRRLPRRSWGT